MIAMPAYLAEYMLWYHLECPVFCHDSSQTENSRINVFDHIGLRFHAVLSIWCMWDDCLYMSKAFQSLVRFDSRLESLPLSRLRVANIIYSATLL